MNNNHISKRKRQALLFFTYGFMTLATVVISAICLLLVLGYRFDIRSGSLEQGGLLQFRSVPAGAKITLDGTLQSFTTPGKIEVETGSHTVTMQLDKYRQWKKTTGIAAGELLWLNYARLVPQNITTTKLASVEGTVQSLATPDKKYMAVLSSTKPSSVVIYNLSNLPQVSSKTVTLPDTLLTKQADQTSSFAFAEWDFGSRYLMLTHTSGTTTEYIRIDRTVDGGAPYNVTKEFNMPFQAIHFSGTSGAVMYALTGKDLRRVDVGAKSVTQPLVTGVESYVLYRENDIAFTATRAEAKVAGIYLDNKETILRRFAVNEPVLVNLTEYFSHKYVAIAAQNRLEIIKDPLAQRNDADKTFASLSLPHATAWLDFASSGRFVLVGTGLQFTSYDIEKESHFTVNGDTAITDMKPRWLDDFNLVDNPTGKLRMYEFDGANRQELVDAERMMPAFLSESGKYLVSFKLAGTATTIQLSQMILE